MNKEPRQAVLSTHTLKNCNHRNKQEGIESKNKKIRGREKKRKKRG